MQDILRTLWDALATKVYRVMSDGENINNATVRAIADNDEYGESHWLYADNCNGFAILSSAEVIHMHLEEEAR